MTGTQDRRLTYSEIQCARTCMRKYQIEYLLCWEKQATVQSLRTGRAFHKALEVRADLLQAKSEAYDSITNKTLAAGLLDYDQCAPRPDADEYQEYILNRILLCQFIRAYCWRWREDDLGLQIIANELTFDLPIINPETGAKSRTYTQGGKIDKIVRFEDYRLAVMEHKTTALDIAPESDYWKRMRIDSQISMYFLAARELGYNVQTVYYDVVRKPAIRPATLTQAQTKDLVDTRHYGYHKAATKASPEQIDIEYGTVGSVFLEGEYLVIDGERTAVEQGTRGFAVRETPGMYSMRLLYELTTNHERYFQRREIPRLDFDIEETRHELWGATKQLRWHEQTGFWSRNDRACTMMGGCPHFDICTTGVDLSGPCPDGYAIGAKHSELTEEN